MGEKTRGDYRIFVGAFPEGAFSQKVQAVREKYDPITARITPPHVTLAGTYWRSGEPTVENEAETIRRMEIMQGILPPFEMRLNGIRTFRGERPVVYMDVALTKEVIEARNLLLSLIGPDKHKQFNPHLTLAMRLPWEEAWTMITELQESDLHTQEWSVSISELHLMLRGSQDRAWRCIYRLDLS
jgi:2'-5' RNA ligase